jgi:2-amino-4-hydroxy-6-hydroxymethyldihydropteridine diphosphokinase
MTTTRRALLGLGSNMGDRVEYLRAAVAAIPDVVAVSDAYETDPVGGVEQDPFLNVVVELDTARTPHELLEVCRERERDAERVRTVRWGPRTLDVDVLWVDGETVDDPPELLVPHPRMFERAFVLVPLADLARDVVPDGYDVAAAATAEGVRNVGRLEEQ